MTVEGVIFHENTEMTMKCMNNGSILYVFTMFRAIGDRSYFFYQGIIDSEIILTKIDTTMNSEEMLNFKNEWLEKWNPGSNDTQA